MPTGVALPLPDGVVEVVSSPAILANAGFMRAAGAGDPSADVRATDIGMMFGASSVFAEAKAVMSTLTNGVATSTLR